jgi:energy-coupling factor transporter ATP-binding protein EcfA2
MISILHVINNLNLSAANTNHIAHTFRKYINDYCNNGAPNTQNIIMFCGTIFEPRNEPFSISIAELNAINIIKAAILSAGTCPNTIVIFMSTSIDQHMIDTLFGADLHILLNPTSISAITFVHRPLLTPNSAPDKARNTICFIGDLNPRVADINVLSESCAANNWHSLYLLCGGDRYAQVKSPPNIIAIAPGPFWSPILCEFGAIKIKIGISAPEFINLAPQTGNTLVIDIYPGRSEIIANCAGLLADNNGRAMQFLQESAINGTITHLKINAHGAQSAALYAHFISAANDHVPPIPITIIGAAEQLSSQDIITNQATQYEISAASIHKHLEAALASSKFPEMSARILQIHNKSIEPITFADPKSAPKYNLHKLCLRNFMTFGGIAPEVLSITDANSLVAIVGANGSGKTSIIDAIMLAIYMKSDRDTLKSFVHINSHTGDVVPNFTIDLALRHNYIAPDNTIVSHYLQIHRERTKSGDNSQKDSLHIVPANAKSAEITNVYAAINSIMHQNFTSSATVIHRGATAVASHIADLCGTADIVLHTAVSQRRYKRQLLGESSAQKRSVYEKLYGLTAVAKISQQINAAITILKKQMTAPISSADTSLTSMAMESRLSDLLATKREIESEYATLKEQLARESTQSCAPAYQLPHDAREIAAKYDLADADPNDISQYIQDHVLCGDSDNDKAIISAASNITFDIKHEIRDLISREKELATATSQKDKLLAINKLIRGLRRDDEIINALMKHGYNSQEIFKRDIAACAKAAKMIEELRIKKAQMIAADKYRELRKLHDAIITARSSESRELGDRQHIDAVARNKIIEKYNTVVRDLAEVSGEIACITESLPRTKESELTFARKSQKITLLMEYKRALDVALTHIICNNMAIICADINNHLAFMNMPFRATLSTSGGADLPSFAIMLGNNIISPHMASGFHADLLDILMRISLWRRYRGAISNFLIFDEPFIWADRENSARLIEFFRHVLSWPDAPQFILFTTCDPLLARNADKTYTISRDEDGNSTFNCGPIPPPIDVADQSITSTNAAQHITRAEDGWFCHICAAKLKNESAIPRHIKSVKHMQQLKQEAIAIY